MIHLLSAARSKSNSSPMNRRMKNCCILFAIAILASPVFAQQRIADNYFSAMQWRCIGPHRGGRVLAVSGVRGQPNTFYFGAVGGGVWKTTDAGQTWLPIFDSQPVASIGALAVSTSNPEVIYVGSGEADMRSDISLGNGVYKSTDAGQTWSYLGLHDTRQIGRILIDPKNPNTVLVAALGHGFGPNTERGVIRSTDGGKSWTRVLYKDENTGAIDLVFDPDNSRTVYASLWNARRVAWNAYPPVTGPGGGLYKSTDGGETWKQITGAAPPEKSDGSVSMYLRDNMANASMHSSMPAQKVVCTFLTMRDKVGRSSASSHAFSAAVGILVKCAATQRTRMSFTFPMFHFTDHSTAVKHSRPFAARRAATIIIRSGSILKIRSA